MLLAAMAGGVDTTPDAGHFFAIADSVLGVAFVTSDFR
jgi:hypothetical protein